MAMSMMHLAMAIIPPIHSFEISHVTLGETLMLRKSRWSAYGEWDGTAWIVGGLLSNSLDATINQVVSFDLDTHEFTDHADTNCSSLCEECGYEEHTCALLFYDAPSQLEECEHNPTHFTSAAGCEADHGVYCANCPRVGSPTPFYVQVDQYLYAIETEASYIVRFDLATGTFNNSLQISIPTPQRDLGINDACLAYSDIDGGYLIVVGGSDSDIPGHTSPPWPNMTQFYSMARDEWHIDRSMNIGRRNAGCNTNTQQDKLYVFGGLMGGTGQTSIERFDLSNIEHGSWVNLGSILFGKKALQRSVKHGDYLILTPHTGDDWIIFDTISETTSLMAYTPLSLKQTRHEELLKAGLSLLSFGGEDTDTWTYALITLDDSGLVTLAYFSN